MSYQKLIRRALALNGQIEVRTSSPTVPPSSVFKFTGWAGLLSLRSGRSVRVYDQHAIDGAPDGCDIATTNVVVPGKEFTIGVYAKYDDVWYVVLEQEYFDSVLVKEYSLNRAVALMEQFNARNAPPKKTWRPFEALKALLSRGDAV